MKKISLLLICLCLSVSAVFTMNGCGSDILLDEISPSDEDTKVVGSAGGKDVLYDELRCITLNYRELLENQYGEGIWDNPITAEKYYPILEEYVYDALTVNCAALITAEKYGISIDDESINDYLYQKLMSLSESLVEEIKIKSDKEDYSPSRKEINEEYKKYLNDYHLTDRYNRYVMSVDGCVHALLLKFIENGTISNDNDTVDKYIHDNFVRVLHVYIKNDEGDNIEENRKLAESSLSKLREGKTTMKQLIGSTVNEDYYLTTMHGYYFTYGEYFEKYEDAAFGLEIGEYSEVIASEDGFYIIQRLELEDDYIAKTFETLKSQYQTSYVNKCLREARDAIEFIPNEYGKTLDLTKIK